MHTRHQPSLYSVHPALIWASLEQDSRNEVMRYLSLAEVLELYRQLMEQSKGMVGVHNLGALESALAQLAESRNQNENFSFRP